MSYCSVIIPVHNERRNVEALYKELNDVIEADSRSYEVIWVNDGSTDGTGPWLEDHESSIHSVLSLRTNFGQSSAMKAGIDHAQGDVIVFMDGDGQNDPADIPKLLSELEDGYDVVSGWRKDREASLLRRILPSRIANSIISYTTGVKLHDYGCSLKAYRAEVLEGLPLYGELHRFLPALASWNGIELKEIPVNDRPRRYGESHYGLGRIFPVVMDLIVVKFLMDYRFRPIRIFGRLSLWTFSGMVAGGGYLAYLKIALSKSLSDNALTTVVILLGIMSVQFLILGLLGEQQARIYSAAAGERHYVIADRLTSDCFTSNTPERQRRSDPVSPN
ncbi:MAG: glycosyltransferase family 2 protein [bacterium]